MPATEMSISRAMMRSAIRSATIAFSVRLKVASDRFQMSRKYGEAWPPFVPLIRSWSVVARLPLLERLRLLIRPRPPGGARKPDPPVRFPGPLFDWVDRIAALKLAQARPTGTAAIRPRQRLKVPLGRLLSRTKANTHCHGIRYRWERHRMWDGAAGRTGHRRSYPWGRTEANTHCHGIRYRWEPHRM
jgi:uncharacterized protein YwbE